jgi:uncharacterized hydrophobic protein (TIGR00271 family)
MLLLKIIEYFRLDGEVDDFETIHQNMEKDVTFKGTNLWILVFAIFVASVGLNVNSTAVIIGAMLISPLMGPINVMGYSIATYNFDLFRRAIKNFSFAVISGLITSTLYFTISPVSTAHSELLARTTPTIYDVLIALLGGLAGIVAASSKKKGNVIPGVAIATALMPPLCTAGYGLATGQITFFFGALYLFTINTVFIALAALIVSQLLKFPITAINLDPNKKKVINRWIYIVILITIIPSVFFGYGLVKNEKFKENASRYVKDVSIIEGNYLLDFEIIPSKREISLTYGGSTISDLEKESLKEKLLLFGLDGTDLKFKQGLKIGDSSNESILKQEISDLKNQIMINELKLEIIANSNNLGNDILNEISAIYPQINQCSFARLPTFVKNEAIPDTMAILIVSTEENRRLSAEDKEKITQWAKMRVNVEKLHLFTGNW